jgi:hypothetical protein
LVHMRFIQAQPRRLTTCKYDFISSKFDGAQIESSAAGFSNGHSSVMVNLTAYHLVLRLELLNLSLDH